METFQFRSKYSSDVVQKVSGTHGDEYKLWQQIQDLIREPVVISDATRVDVVSARNIKSALIFRMLQNLFARQLHLGEIRFEYFAA